MTDKIHFFGERWRQISIKRQDENLLQRTISKNRGMVVRMLPLLLPTQCTHTHPRKIYPREQNKAHIHSSNWLYVSYAKKIHMVVLLRVYLHLKCISRLKCYFYAAFYKAWDTDFSIIKMAHTNSVIKCNMSLGNKNK